MKFSRLLIFHTYIKKEPFNILEALVFNSRNESQVGKKCPLR